ncbi:MAG: hypothetical protein KDK39_01220 [Leptospiraceae bacterium]|nr:hypothetical protein [Leptospiraceae bacterium]
MLLSSVKTPEHRRITPGALLWNCLLIPILLLPLIVSTGLSARDLEKAGSEFVCRKVKESSHKHIAVFPFMDEQDTESSATKLSTALFISALTKCPDVTIIEKAKTEQVLTEQANAQSGLIDAHTAPRIGQLIGADTLVFGALLNKALELRLVDAESGTILGAAVQLQSDSSPAAESSSETDQSKTAVTALDPAAAEQGLQQRQMKIVMERMFHQTPALFLYTSATRSELIEFERRKPQGARRLHKRIQSMPADRQQLIHNLQQLISQERTRNNQFNRRIQQMRRKAMQGLRLSSP